MEVYGFQLPAAFVQLQRDIRERNLDSIWVQKNRVDAFGRPWEVSDITFADAIEEIKEDIDFLRQCFRQGGFHQIEQARNAPGFVADFTDVSKLVWFGRMATGDPYCFDFGNDPEKPSIIFWETAPGFCYWRRVAPDFESFIALFQPSSEAEPFDPGDEEWELVMSLSRPTRSGCSWWRWWRR
jgi:SMI1/KNR4 family protein SUKH-1